MEQTTVSGSKYMSTKMFLLYGIFGLILGMISALGTVGMIIDIFAQIATLIAVIMIIRDAMKKQVATVNWILLVIVLFVYYFSRTVSFG